VRGEAEPLLCLGDGSYRRPNDDSTAVALREVSRRSSGAMKPDDGEGRAQGTQRGRDRAHMSKMTARMTMKQLAELTAV